MAEHNVAFCCPVPAADVICTPGGVRRSRGEDVSGSRGRGCSSRRLIVRPVATTAGLEWMQTRWAGPPEARRVGLPLVGSGEPRFGEDVAGHGRFDVLVAGRAFQRDRLVPGE